MFRYQSVVSKRNKTFFCIILTESGKFLFNPKTWWSNSKRNIIDLVHLKTFCKLYKNLETKHIICFWTKNLRSERKRFDSTMNFYSKTNIFDFLVTKVGKWKLPILKKRWFDLAIKALLQTKCKCYIYISLLFFLCCVADIRFLGWRLCIGSV